MCVCVEGCVCVCLGVPAVEVYHPISSPLKHSRSFHPVHPSNRGCVLDCRGKRNLRGLAVRERESGVGELTSLWVTSC